MSRNLQFAGQFSVNGARGCTDAPSQNAAHVSLHQPAKGVQDQPEIWNIWNKETHETQDRDNII